MGAIYSEPEKYTVSTQTPLTPNQLVFCNGVPLEVMREKRSAMPNQNNVERKRCGSCFKAKSAQSCESIQEEEMDTDNCDCNSKIFYVNSPINDSKLCNSVLQPESHKKNHNCNCNSKYKSNDYFNKNEHCNITKYGEMPSYEEENRSLYRRPPERKSVSQGNLLQAPLKGNRKSKSLDNNIGTKNIEVVSYEEEEESPSCDCLLKRKHISHARNCPQMVKKLNKSSKVNEVSDTNKQESYKKDDRSLWKNESTYKSMSEEQLALLKVSDKKAHHLHDNCNMSKECKVPSNMEQKKNTCSCVSKKPQILQQQKLTEMSMQKVGVSANINDNYGTLKEKNISEMPPNYKRNSTLNDIFEPTTQVEVSHCKKEDDISRRRTSEEVRNKKNLEFLNYSNSNKQREACSLIKQQGNACSYHPFQRQSIPEEKGIINEHSEECSIIELEDNSCRCDPSQTKSIPEQNCYSNKQREARSIVQQKDNSCSFPSQRLSIPEQKNNSLIHGETCSIVERENCYDSSRIQSIPLPKHIKNEHSEAYSIVESKDNSCICYPSKEQSIPEEKGNINEHSEACSIIESEDNSCRCDPSQTKSISEQNFTLNKQQEACSIVHQKDNSCSFPSQRLSIPEPKDNSLIHGETCSIVQQEDCYDPSKVQSLPQRKDITNNHSEACSIVESKDSSFICYPSHEQSIPEEKGSTNEHIEACSNIESEDNSCRCDPSQAKSKSKQNFTSNKQQEACSIVHQKDNSCSFPSQRLSIPEPKDNSLIHGETSSIVQQEDCYDPSKVQSIPQRKDVTNKHSEACSIVELKYSSCICYPSQEQSIPEEKGNTNEHIEACSNIESEDSSCRCDPSQTKSISEQNFTSIVHQKDNSCSFPSQRLSIPEPKDNSLIHGEISSIVQQEDCYDPSKVQSIPQRKVITNKHSEACSIVESKDSSCICYPSQEQSIPEENGNTNEHIEACSNIESKDNSCRCDTSQTKSISEQNFTSVVHQKDNSCSFPSQRLSIPEQKDNSLIHGEPSSIVHQEDCYDPSKVKSIPLPKDITNEHSEACSIVESKDSSCICYPSQEQSIPEEKGNTNEHIEACSNIESEDSSCRCDPSQTKSISEQNFTSIVHQKDNSCSFPSQRLSIPEPKDNSLIHGETCSIVQQEDCYDPSKVQSLPQRKDITNNHSETCSIVESKDSSFICYPSHEQSIPEEKGSTNEHIEACSNIESEDNSCRCDPSQTKSKSKQNFTSNKQQEACSIVQQKDNSCSFPSQRLSIPEPKDNSLIHGETSSIVQQEDCYDPSKVQSLPQRKDITNEHSEACSIVESKDSSCICYPSQEQSIPEEKGNTNEHIEACSNIESEDSSCRCDPSQTKSKSKQNFTSNKQQEACSIVQQKDNSCSFPSQRLSIPEPKDNSLIHGETSSIVQQEDCYDPSKVQSLPQRKDITNKHSEACSIVESKDSSCICYPSQEQSIPEENGNTNEHIEACSNIESKDNSCRCDTSQTKSISEQNFTSNKQQEANSCSFPSQRLSIPEPKDNSLIHGETCSIVQQEDCYDPSKVQSLPQRKDITNNHSETCSIVESKDSSFICYPSHEQSIPEEKGSTNEHIEACSNIESEDNSCRCDPSQTKSKSKQNFTSNKQQEACSIVQQKDNSCSFPSQRLSIPEPKDNSLIHGETSSIVQQEDCYDPSKVQSLPQRKDITNKHSEACSIVESKDSSCICYPSQEQSIPEENGNTNEHIEACSNIESKDNSCRCDTSQTKSISEQNFTSNKQQEANSCSFPSQRLSIPEQKDNSLIHGEPSSIVHQEDCYDPSKVKSIPLPKDITNEHMLHACSIIELKDSSCSCELSQKKSIPEQKDSSNTLREERSIVRQVDTFSSYPSQKLSISEQKSNSNKKGGTCSIMEPENNFCGCYPCQRKLIAEEKCNTNKQLELVRQQEVNSFGCFPSQRQSNPEENFNYKKNRVTCSIMECENNFCCYHPTKGQLTSEQQGTSNKQMVFADDPAMNNRNSKLSNIFEITKVAEASQNNKPESSLTEVPLKEKTNKQLVGNCKKAESQAELTNIKQEDSPCSCYTQNLIPEAKQFQEESATCNRKYKLNNIFEASRAEEDPYYANGADNLCKKSLSVKPIVKDLQSTQYEKEYSYNRKSVSEEEFRHVVVSNKQSPQLVDNCNTNRNQDRNSNSSLKQKSISEEKLCWELNKVNSKENINSRKLNYNTCEQKEALVEPEPDILFSVLSQESVKPTDPAHYSKCKLNKKKETGQDVKFCNCPFKREKGSFSKSTKSESAFYSISDIDSNTYNSIHSGVSLTTTKFQSNLRKNVCGTDSTQYLSDLDSLQLMSQASSLCSADVKLLNNFEHECLNEHNRLRDLHNCPPLKLNSKLSQLALNWANHISRSKTIRRDDKNKYGENMYISVNINLNGSTPVLSWYKEISKYDFKKPRFHPNTGHFSQVIWKETKEIGVGMVTKDKSTWVVVYYNPPGNLINKFSSNVPPIV